jgi:hypothetical protein
VEPSRASIPRGQYFSFRLLDAAEFAGYTVHWMFNGRRIPGAHKAELGFYHMRPRFDGEYKALLVKGKEILASNAVTLETLAAEAKAVVVEAEEKPEDSDCFFDPLAPEDEPPPAQAEAEAESGAEDKKRAFLKKALAKAKKAA